MRTLVAFVSVRTLFAMVVALAVLFAPAIGRGDALAAVPNHDMRMMQTGHCHSPTSRKSHHQHDMNCCTAMSAGVAPTLDRAVDEFLDQVAPSPVPPAAADRPFLAELATPPPRSA